MSLFHEALNDRPLVAILRGIKPAEVDEVCDALVEAGVRFIEVPLNSPSPWTSIEALVKRAPSNVIVGAGTVLHTGDVKRLKETGAELMVTPNTDPEVIEAADDAGLYSLVGCATPSEAFQAIKHGATGLKLFPAARFGCDYLKDIKSVLPSRVPVLAVGGIGIDTMGEWHAAGVNGFGYGSMLYTPGKAAREVGETAREIVAEWQRLQELSGKLEGLQREVDQ
ncbi:MULTISPECIES: 2-dehydro-3-deoxy-6-phosphogalactonate aldolase [Larsenimonas]|uniref:2-dehydro-3-deoxy-6-phosphogalactonate aldolase n=1 Tax=Larsenimonas suaedae TaxID=1851019 RepID=A0ABU1GWH1_9GAMM|nr:MULTISPECIES: 2-dehydro-3-deoxy-6-phosphogalactonate aldolase [Larsenimonas]MCM2972971.1 2-dehydro-3-deoxy-6-phosphogalactonate aldolase [Larsenimonas suaedae]MCM5704915.1 2-dehydro-3-deoxy-6-phosphogalactonate aldolase [Larsenimonas salina]MDR5896408.1 2-dehydro-3-deoxy-6-phosphogalactonate aldolase [Larsenimonas suaedae]